ncbi:hypothetical protein CP973_22690 [Streptomyces albofaciens JCM 4342]|nr:hypothetical protein CP973_22690 [Streptomyces albofaciens JCM 4342]
MPRCLVRAYERLVQHSETMITWTAITLMTRCVTQPPRQALRRQDRPATLPSAAPAGTAATSNACG